MVSKVEGMNWESLFVDEAKLAIVCEKCEDVGEFPNALFQYFDSYSKSEQLIKWAFKRDVCKTGRVKL